MRSKRKLWWLWLFSELSLCDIDAQCRLHSVNLSPFKPALMSNDIIIVKLSHFLVKSAELLLNHSVAQTKTAAKSSRCAMKQPICGVVLDLTLRQTLTQPAPGVNPITSARGIFSPCLTPEIDKLQERKWYQTKGLDETVETNPNFDYLASI